LIQLNIPLNIPSSFILTPLAFLDVSRIKYSPFCDDKSFMEKQANCKIYNPCPWGFGRLVVPGGIVIRLFEMFGRNDFFDILINVWDEAFK
jgi:hypothetical protein